MLGTQPLLTLLREWNILSISAHNQPNFLFPPRLQEHPRKHQNGDPNCDKDQTTGTLDSIPLSRESQPSDTTKANEYDTLVFIN